VTLSAFLAEFDMKNCIPLILCVAMLCGIAGAKGQKANKGAKAKPKEETTVSELKLPEKVRATFVDKFPNAVINKLESEKEGGVTVWDIEFRDRQTYKETDIADDGTMLEYTVHITKKTMPKPVMKAVEAAAKKEEAAMGTMERIEVSYETKDGKVVKLPKPVTRYAMEMIKDKQTAEIVVDEKGKVVEEPKWETAKGKEKKSAA
jgi:hypothetical protein